MYFAERIFSLNTPIGKAQSSGGSPQENYLALMTVLDYRAFMSAAYEISKEDFLTLEKQTCFIAELELELRFHETKNLVLIDPNNPKIRLYWMRYHPGKNRKRLVVDHPDINTRPLIEAPAKIKLEVNDLLYDFYHKSKTTRQYFEG